MFVICLIFTNKLYQIQYIRYSGGSRIFQGGGANPQLRVAGIHFIKISRKLHEIEKNLVAWGGGGRSLPWIRH